MPGGRRGSPAEFASHKGRSQLGKNPHMAAWEHRAKRAFTAWRTADLHQLLISLCATWCRNIKQKFQNLTVFYDTGKATSPLLEYVFCIQESQSA